MHAIYKQNLDANGQINICFFFRSRIFDLLGTAGFREKSVAFAPHYSCVCCEHGQGSDSIRFRVESMLFLISNMHNVIPDIHTRERKKRISQKQKKW